MTAFEAASGKPTTVAIPSASPSPGVYQSGVSVALNCATTGAQIHFTTDNSEPTSASALYLGSLNLSVSTVVKAVAIKEGFPISPVFGGYYLVQTGIPVPTPSTGTFSTDQTISLASDPGATLYYTDDGTDPANSVSRKTYTAPLVLNGSATQVVSLNIKAVAVRPGCLDSNLFSGTFSVDYNRVSTPQFFVVPGTYTSDKTVTITSDAGSTIYYTLDSSDPLTSASRQVYSSPLNLVGSSSGPVPFTIKAASVKSGMQNSTVATGAYVIAYQGSGSGTVASFPVVSLSPGFDAVTQSYPPLESTTFTASVMVAGLGQTATQLSSIHWYLDSALVASNDGSLTATFATSSLAEKDYLVTCVVQCRGTTASASTYATWSTRGTPLHEYYIGYALPLTPTVLLDGRLAVAGSFGIFLQDSSGIFHNNNVGAMNTLITAAPDGTCYFADSSGTIHEVSYTTSWETNLSVATGYAPVAGSALAMDPLGYVYYGSADGHLFKFDKNLTQVATINTAMSIVTSPVVSRAGYVVVGTTQSGGSFVGIYNSGNLGYVNAPGYSSTNFSNIALANGILNFIDGSGHLQRRTLGNLALSTESWGASPTVVPVREPCFATLPGSNTDYFSWGNQYYEGSSGLCYQSESVNSTTLTTCDWVVYLDGKNLLAQSTDSGTKAIGLYHYGHGAPPVLYKVLRNSSSVLVTSTAPPCVAPDGSIVIPGEDKYLYVFKGVGPLGLGGWPQVQKNARHTGYEND